MKTIDFDQKIAQVQGDLAASVPKAAAPKRNIVINDSRLKVALRIISNELLRDPVVVSMMAFRNDPTPTSMETFLKTVRTHLDFATRRRYEELLDGVFRLEEVK